MRLLLKLLIFSHLFYIFSLFSEEKEKIIPNPNTVKWQYLKNKEDTNIIWKSFDKDEDLLNKIDSEIDQINKKDSILKIENIIVNKIKKKQKAIEIQPYLPINNYLKSGTFDSSIYWKSSFSGGDSGGSGNQNIGIRFDYGLSNDSLFSLYLAETDDPLYNFIDGIKTPNNWASVGLAYKKKIFEGQNKKDTLSIASSLEYWKVHSGTGNIKSIFNEIDNTPSSDKYEKFIYSFSLPYSKKLNDKTKLSIVPGANFLPGKLGTKNIGKNFYGNNLFLATGINFNLSEDFQLIGSYTFLFGPGHNSFDEYLKFHRKPIYSYGFLWDVNNIIGLEGKITNGYGNTPATGLLTIPSDNQPLYYVGAIYRPSQIDDELFPIKNNDKPLLFGGLTVNNALIPARGESQISLDYDQSGNIFGFYGYSLSNIFQIQLKTGSFNDVTLDKNNNSKLRSTYFNKNNYDYRFGAKLLVFSPQKFDSFWMSLRTSVGRNEGDNHQGYMFNELINTFRINNRVHLNVNPKYFFSGVESFGGIGISSNIRILDNLHLIPEVNTSLRHKQKRDINSSLVLSYSYSPRKSIDLYYSNAAGSQDIGQLFGNEGYKFGLRLNFIY